MLRALALRNTLYRFFQFSRGLVYRNGLLRAKFDPKPG